MRLHICLVIVGFVISTVCKSQNIEWYVTGNGNLYLSSGNPQKGIYPVIGYDKESDPKFLIGGLGLGLAAYKAVREKISLKGQVNLSRNVYWDEPSNLNSGPDPSQSLGKYVGGASNLCFSFSGTPHYFITSGLSAGAGLGARVLLLSVSRLPEATNLSQKGSVSVNNFYKPILPFIPTEASFKFKKILLNVRYEWALLNSFKNELSKYKADKYGLLFFEVGYKIR